MYGKDYSYANTRLADTVVRLEKCGTPIYVYGVNADGSVTYSILGGNGDDKSCHLDDIDTCPVPLGYVNHQRGCAFLERTPVRRYRQGLRRDNMACRDGMNPASLSWAAIAKTIKGEYPTLDQAVAQAKKLGASVAWHRFWAIDSALNLYYKSTHVGILKNKKNPEFVGKFKYLKESLEASV